jgi:hypothetical protein
MGKYHDFGGISLDSCQRAYSCIIPKVSDHGTIGPRKFSDFPENISSKKIIV